MNETTFSSSPLLTNGRIWVVAPMEDSQELCFWLEDEGASVLAMPSFSHRESAVKSLQAAVEQLHRYSWLIVHDVLSAAALADRVREAGNWDWASQVKKVAVGEVTAQALSRAKLPPQWTFENEEGLMAVIREQGAADQELLWLKTHPERPAISDSIEAHGLRITLLETARLPSDLEESHLWSELRQFQANVVLVPSAAVAESLGASLVKMTEELLPAARWVANGATTAQVLASKRLPVHEVAGGSTPHNLIEAAVRALQGSPSSSCESATPS